MTKTLYGIAVWTVVMVVAVWFGGRPIERQPAPIIVPSTTTTTSSSTTTTTTTTTTIAPAKGTSVKRCPDLEPLLAEYGLPADPFSYIAWRESRCNPGAVNAKWNEAGEMVYALNANKTWDTGLLQVNSIHRNLVREVCGKAALKNNLAGLMDLDCQLRVAARLYDNGKGLSHWRATYKQDN